MGSLRIASCPTTAPSSMRTSSARRRCPAAQRLAAVACGGSAGAREIFEIAVLGQPQLGRSTGDRRGGDAVFEAEGAGPPERCAAGDDAVFDQHAQRPAHRLGPHFQRFREGGGIDRLVMVEIQIPFQAAQHPVRLEVEPAVAGDADAIEARHRAARRSKSKAAASPS